MDHAYEVFFFFFYINNSFFPSRLALLDCILSIALYANVMQLFMISVSYITVCLLYKYALALHIHNRYCTY